MSHILRKAGLTRDDVQRLTAGMMPVTEEAAPKDGGRRWPREVVLRVVEMRDAGATYNQIVQETGVPYGTIPHLLERGEGMMA